jgi:hypothetical protein
MSATSPEVYRSKCTWDIARNLQPRADCANLWDQAKRSAFRRLPGNKHRRKRGLMSCRSPRNVIVVNWAPEPFARACESLPIGRDYRSAGRSDRGPSGVTLRDLIEREREGS